MRKPHEQNMKEIQPSQDDPADVKKMTVSGLTFNWILRVAAILFIGLLGYGAFQFVNVNPDQIYDDHFINYNLPISRSANFQMTILDSLYLEKNYQGVIGSFQSEEEKSERDYFLAAVSYMQSEQYEQAVLLFLQLQQADQARLEQKFQQETDYYLALAYLKTGQFDNALTLFEQIHQQPEHLFHPHVSQLMLWKLKLLEMKQ